MTDKPAAHKASLSHVTTCCLACGAPVTQSACADIVSGKVVQELRYHREIVRDLAWHPHLPMMVTTAFDGSVVQWDPQQVRHQ